ncbi:MAG: Rrf2 family transcriptional regulator [Deinococcota bacterium]
MIGRNTHFTLAVHILTVLALYEMTQAGPAPSAKLAESVDTNPAFLRQQIGRLKQAGFVTTKLGMGGGTVLAQKPDTITLLDIYRSTEGQTTLHSHHIREGSTCPVGSNIGSFFDTLAQELDSAIATQLTDITIQDVATELFQKSQQSSELVSST